MRDIVWFLGWYFFCRVRALVADRLRHAPDCRRRRDADVRLLDCVDRYGEFGRVGVPHCKIIGR